MKDYLHLHFLVVIWGFTAIFGRLISIPAVELVFFRTLLACLLLGILCAWQRKSVQTGFRPAVHLLLTGAVVSLHWILFFAAARVANVSVCLAGMATTSLWTSLLEPLMQRRPIRWIEIGLGLMVLIGLYVIFQFEFDKALGLVMAMGSAMLAALFSVLNARFARLHDPQVVSLYEMGGACLTTAVVLPIFATFFYGTQPIDLAPEGWDWLWILLLASVCTVYAYSASVYLLRKFSPFAMNLATNLEPVYGILLAVLIFGESEKMTSGFYLGTLLILLAVLVYPFLYKKTQSLA